MSNCDRVSRLLLTGVPGWLSLAFLENIKRNPLPGLQKVRCLVMKGTSDSFDLPIDCEIVEGDLRSAESLKLACQGVDGILHAAGVIHVRRTNEWYDINTSGTVSLAKAAIDQGVRRFVFVSSNAAAGRSHDKNHLLTEEMQPNPLCHYGRSKLFAEESLKKLRDQLEIVILRPCMFYGPPVPMRHVDVYKRLLRGHMPVVGTGDYARSVTHIDHLVEACYLALCHPAAANQTYFIADQQIYTTLEIINAMGQALGANSNYVHLPSIIAPFSYQVDKVLSRFGIYWQNIHLLGEANWHVGVSSKKAQVELGYNPKYDFREGICQAIEWCRGRNLL